MAERLSRRHRKKHLKNMSADKETIRERLEKLSGVIKLLEKYRQVSREDFLIDFTIP